MSGFFRLTNQQIIADLQKLVGKEQVLYTRVEREARAGDASIYRLVPRVVVLPRSIRDVQALLDYCRTHELYLTFRAAGTSLSGQAVTDGILVDVATHWKGVKVLDEGRRVAVQPGVIGARVNDILAPYRAKIGPDPASINACMIGGIAANNASGMCCDVAGNTYHTMASMRFVLADGFELDTSAPDADEVFAAQRPALYQGLLNIREKIWSRPDLVERIRTKFSIKNTCGYSMNAFVDFERPVDILAHLLVGSEGTLGFIAEITYNTVRDYPCKATALVYFADFVDAHRSVKPLADAGAAVLEIMDAAAMRSVEQMMHYSFRVESEMGALLVEFQEDEEAELAARVAEAERILNSYRLLEPLNFTRDPAQRALYWKMRKGLFPSVGAMREIGTAVIIEDVCVRPEQLADCARDLQHLFVKHSFPDTIIFGHAKAGNLHFVICTDFSDPEQKRHYAELMDDLMALIVKKYDGSLKAEHGTGRNVAPFVELEWGSEIYGLMWEVKRLLDPWNMLNPGVLLNRDPEVHLRSLKVMPSVSPIVDKCIECGYCESHCPSRELTLTPRQRIALLREIRRLKTSSDPAAAAEASELEQEYEYYGVATCAGDSLCATACPVDIDTGELVKNLRAERHPAFAKKIAEKTVEHFACVEGIVRTGLRIATLGGSTTHGLACKITSLAHKLTRGKLPAIPQEFPFPKPAARLPTAPKPETWENAVLYFPSCLTRAMGKLDGERVSVGLAEAVVAVLRACEYSPFIPSGVHRYCCGQPYLSKGFFDAAAQAARRTMDFLWDATRGGEVPVVCDTSSCSYTLIRSYGKLLSGNALKRWQALRLFDFPSFFVREILPRRTEWPKLDRRIILHPVCALTKLGNVDDFRKLAETFATHVTVPRNSGCCGFAGDRGYLVPELTRSATKPEAQEVLLGETVLGRPFDGYYSTNRACEIGLSAATGRTYESIVYLCYEALCRNNARS